MFVRVILRVTLVAAVLAFFLPDVDGVKFHGDIFSALVASLVFNLAFFGLEWLLGVVAFGINVSTLGLGVFLTNTIKFLASLLAPSAALYGTAHVLPKFLSVSHYWPNAIVGGLVLGGVLFVTVPQGKKK